MRKYFNRNLGYYMLTKNLCYISNKFTGEYMKVPTECFEVLNYSFENNLPINELYNFFELKEDQEYFKQILKALENIDLISSNTEEFKAYFIPNITIAVTDRCNLKCKYCVGECGEKNNEYEELDLTQVKKVIDKVLDLKPTRISITGGEPFLRDDIIDILSYINQKFNGRIILSTNATLIKEEQIKFLNDILYSIEISLDGYSEETVYVERGKGVFKKVINVIKKFQSYGFKRISISLVVSKNTINYVNEFKNLADNLKVKPTFRRFVKLGRGKKFSKEYLDDELDIKFFRYDDKKNNFGFASSCQAGSSHIYIDTKGDIYPCPILDMKDFKLGNIIDFNDEDITNLLNRNNKIFDVLENLKPINRIECKDCKNRLFCFSCLAELANIDDNISFNHNCVREKQLLLK